MSDSSLYAQHSQESPRSDGGKESQNAWVKRVGCAASVTDHVIELVPTRLSNECVAQTWLLLGGIGRLENGRGFRKFPPRTKSPTDLQR